MSLTQYTEKIDEGTIQKMCRNIFTLQQTISNITFTREVALDHARSYFQLFFITPEVCQSAFICYGLILRWLIKLIIRLVCFNLFLFIFITKYFE